MPQPGHIEGSGWPSVRYGPNGENEVFTCEADVPKGWADTPDAFKKSEAAKPVEKAKPAEKQEIPLSRSQIIAALKQRKASFSIRATDAALYAQLVQLIEDSEA